MPVDKSSSIAMDSTLGSSPSHVQTPKIKRATYTYGRRRPASPDGHSSSSASSSGSRESVFKTGLHHQDEEIPPSSEASRWPSDSEPAGDDSEEDDEPQKFAFDWKQKLRELDEDLEDSETMVGVKTTGHDPGVNAPMPAQGAVPRGSFLGSPSSPSEDFDIHKEISRSPTDATGSTRANLSRLSPQSSGRSRIQNLNPKVLGDFNSSSGAAHSPAKQAVGSPTAAGEEMQRYTLSKSMVQLKKPSRTKSSLESDDDEMLEPPRKVPSNPRRQGKIKPPTKKELAETAKSRLRIAAEQEVSIPRLQASGKYSMSSFLSSIARPESTSAVMSSDPILPLSSSPSREGDDTTESKQQSAPPHSPPRQVDDIFGAPSPLLLPAAPAPPVDEESPPLHTAPSVNEEVQRKRFKELMELKQRAAAMQAAKIEQRLVEDDAEEDGLDIVLTSPKKEMNLIIEEEARRSGKKSRISEVRIRQLQLGGVASKRIDHKTPKKNDLVALLNGEETKKSKGKSPVTHADLNKALRKKINDDSLRMARKKEEEWVRRGGKVAKESAGEQQPSNLQEVWKSYAKKSLEARAETQDESEDEDEDGDWNPALRGSASPVPGADDEDSETDGNHDRGSVNDSGDDLAEGDRGGAGAIDGWNDKGKGPRPIRRTALRIDSDSELDGENMVSTGRRLVKGSIDENSAAVLRIPPTRQHLQSFSSDEPTEDEGDKENDHLLVFDEGEDKENIAATRSGVQNALAFGSQVTRDHSVSPTPRGRGLTHDHGPSRPDITPFRAVDDDSFPLEPGSSTITSFAARLRRSSSQKSSPTPPPLRLERSPGFEPLLNAGGKDKASGFSQFLDDEESTFLAPPFQGGLSELFEEGTEKPKPRGLSKTLSKAGKGTLGLTQDIELDVALQVRDDLLQKADAIFEREQEDILASTTKSSKQEIYVNELGFLTQTRPDGSSPEVYKFNSPSQTSFRDRNISLTSSVITSSGGRQPLRTISFTQIDFEPESPSQAPLRRLRRIDESPVLASSSHQLNRLSRSPSPSLSASVRKRNQPVNAFDLLGEKGKQKEERLRKRLEKSDFVQAEAEESDEENKFGFGVGIKKDEEEEDGEDLDKTLETLVDDGAMDEATLAAERVLEKFKEQEDQEDQEIEKLHQAAIQGELRRKRRSNGIGFDDSDDDSDEDERNRGIRKGMYKKQKIDRDNIKALGNNDETKSFYRVYEHDLMDDDMELEYLRQPEEDVVMTGAIQGTRTITGTQPDNDENDNEDEEEYDSDRYITRDEIIRRVRELGQRPQDEVEESLNPHDVSWIDDEMSTEDFGRPQVRVKEMSSKRLARRFNNVSDSGLVRGRGTEAESAADIERSGVTTTIMEGEWDRDRLQSWAKVESRSRVAGTTGRSVGGAAITGHVTARSRTKQGGGSFRSGHAASKAKEAEAKEKPQTKPLAAMPSVLAGVSDRSSRFA